MSYLKYTFFLAIIGLIAACSSNQKEAKTEKEMPKEQVTTPTPNTNYSTHNVPWSEISSFDKVDFDYLVPYGEAELQIGELRTPLSQDTFPLVIFIHGGCWMSAYNLDHVSTVCADLVKEGYAVWTPEYRRVGNEGSEKIILLVKCLNIISTQLCKCFFFLSHNPFNVKQGEVFAKSSCDNCLFKVI